MLVTAVCVSVCPYSHYCTHPDTSWGMVGVPSSCALLGGSVIGARFRCYDNKLRRRNVSECL